MKKYSRKKYSRKKYSRKKYSRKKSSRKKSSRKKSSRKKQIGGSGMDPALQPPAGATTKTLSEIKVRGQGEIGPRRELEALHAVGEAGVSAQKTGRMRNQAKGQGESEDERNRRVTQERKANFLKDSAAERNAERFRKETLAANSTIEDMQRKLDAANLDKERRASEFSELDERFKMLEEENRKIQNSDEEISLRRARFENKTLKEALDSKEKQGRKIITQHRKEMYELNAKAAAEKAKLEEEFNQKLEEAKATKHDLIKMSEELDQHRVEIARQAEDLDHEFEQKEQEFKKKEVLINSHNDFLAAKVREAEETALAEGGRAKAAEEERQAIHTQLEQMEADFQERFKQASQKYQEEKEQQSKNDALLSDAVARALKENKRLEADNQGLREENKSLQAESDAMGEENQRVQAESDAVAEENQSLRAENQSLQKDIRELRAALDTMVAGWKKMDAGQSQLSLAATGLMDKSSRNARAISRGTTGQ